MTDLDAIDRKILRILQRDGRIATTELAEQVGLSATPCARRLKRLEEEGFIRGYTEVETKGHKELEIELKYHDGEPVIRELTRGSTPGRRVYPAVSDLKPHRQGLGVSILSTPQGVMTDNTAREKNVGGEVLCQVF